LRSRDFAASPFEALPAAAQELEAVGALLGVKPQVGAEAAEAAVKAARAPRVLHIATHAFFMEDAPEPDAAGRLTRSAGRANALLFENPLLRSGLVFAGANGLASGREDGILTALEASALDLSGTELLILSACDTGLGEVRNSDGVYGLRRAFALAGVRSQVMSLWKVNDEGTRRLMTQYYDELLRGAGRSEALRIVQLKMMRDPVLRSPYYWASFVLAGDWGPLE
jgi:CHAT domain-containing protein